MELPFQVKHHTRPHDFLYFFQGTTGTTKNKKMAQAPKEIKFFLPHYHWKRPFKSNVHGIVFNRTSKTTLKPHWHMDFSHVWLKTKNLALAGRQPMHFVVIYVLCIHVVEFLILCVVFQEKHKRSILRQKEKCLAITKMRFKSWVVAE